MPPKISNISSEDCVKWQSNPSVNPLTNRSIKLNGPTYNEIQKACQAAHGTGIVKQSSKKLNSPGPSKPLNDKLAGKPSNAKKPNVPDSKQTKPDKKPGKRPGRQKLTRHVCQRLREYQSLNPFTMKLWNPSDPTYVNIISQCRKKYFIFINQFQNELYYKEVLPAIEGPYDTYSTYRMPKPQTSANNGSYVLNVKQSDINVVTDRRRSLFTKVQPSLNSVMNNIYKFLHICEAPLNFNASLRTIDVFMPPLLHILHGDYIMPVDFRIESGIPYNQASPGIILEMDIGSPDFEQYIEKFRQGPTNIAFMKVGVYIKTVGAHAMMLVFVKVGTYVKVSIINPNFVANCMYSEIWLEYLHAIKNKYGLIDGGVLINTKTSDKFQAGAEQLERSSMDRRGFCVVWVMLMMEIMAINAAKGVKYDVDVLDLLTLPDELEGNDPHAWHKMIIDYLFTRMIDGIVLARFLRNGYVYRKLETAMNPYISQVYNGRVLAQIANYVPNFTTESLPRIYKYMLADG